MIVIYILGYFVILLISIYLILSLSGFFLLKKGQQPFDYQVLENDGGKYVITNDSRKVEYFVFGNTDPQSKVIICIHGSGPEAVSEVNFNEKCCIELGHKRYCHKFAWLWIFGYEARETSCRLAKGGFRGCS